MFRNAFYIGRYFGIPVRIHLSWLIVFALITIYAAETFPSLYPGWPAWLYWALGVVASLLFFVSVLAHEMAHSLVARRRGLKVRDIVLFIFGGVSQIVDESKTAGAEFWIAVVGPLTSLIIGVVAVTVGVFAHDYWPPVSALGFYLGTTNILLAFFNMIPGYPLDGGRVLRSILWKATGNMDRSTQWAARVGQAVAYLFIFLGVLCAFEYNVGSGIWLAFIGWFLVTAALSSYRQVEIKHSLGAHRVDEVMIRDYPAVGPDATADSIMTEYFLRWNLHCLPVVLEDQMVGLVTLHDVNRIAQDRWSATSAADVMVPADKVKTSGPDANLWDALVRMTAEEVNQLPVVENGRLVGLLTRGRVLSFLRTNAEHD